MIFAKDLHITPNILDTLEFYRIEMILKQYEDYIEEKNEQERKQQSAQEAEMKKNQQSYSPPSYQNSFKMPSMNMPKF